MHRRLRHRRRQHGPGRSRGASGHVTPPGHGGVPGEICSQAQVDGDDAGLHSPDRCPAISAIRVGQPCANSVTVAVVRAMIVARGIAERGAVGAAAKRCPTDVDRIDLGPQAATRVGFRDARDHAGAVPRDRQGRQGRQQARHRSPAYCRRQRPFRLHAPASRPPIHQPRSTACHIFMNSRPVPAGARDCHVVDPCATIPRDQDVHRPRISPQTGRGVDAADGPGRASSSAFSFACLGPVVRLTRPSPADGAI